MRILIKDPLTSAETVLCDGPGRGVNANHGPLDGLSIDDQIVTQVAEFLRGTSIKAYNRKNQRTTIGFRIARECESLIAAHAWQLAFHSGCIRSGTIYMIEISSAGVEQRVRIENAVISSLRTTPLGVTRIVDFQIIGGPFTL